MSGPKTSDYTLTEEQRERLIKARELARKTRAAYERKENILKKVLGYIINASEIYERLKKISTETGKNTAEDSDF